MTSKTPIPPAETGAPKPARDTVYDQARQSLAARLSSHDGLSPEAVEIEMTRLDHATETVESAVGDIFEPDPEMPRRVSDLDGTSAPTDRSRPPIAEGGRVERQGRRAAERFMRLIPPLRIGGLVLRVIGVMSNPFFLMGSLVVGVYVGLYMKGVTAVLAPVADTYVELLKMVLIPFLVSAIVVSFSRLFGTEVAKRHLGPIFTVFGAGLVLVAVIGVGFSIAAAPGRNINGSARQALGQVINKSLYAVDLEVALNSPPSSETKPPEASFLDRIIPDNIFRALSLGDNLKILFFAIAFGIGLGSLQAGRGDGLRRALLSVYDVCTQLIAWVNMLLPIALCGMVAKQVGSVGSNELLAMLRFTAGFGLVAALVCALSLVAVSWASGSGIVKAFKAVREPLLLAMATRSSITCIPSATTSLIDKLGYDKDRVELLLPLGITLFRFGPVLYYSFTTMFFAQLYNVDISVFGYLLIVVGAMLTGLASAGTTGVLTISLLGVIFQPLGLPVEAALALLVTIDPVIDMFRTACIVLPNCAAVAIVYRGNGLAGHLTDTGERRIADLRR